MDNWTRRGFIATAGSASLSACTGTASKEGANIDRRVRRALNEMSDALPFTDGLRARAAGMLIMPTVAKGGVIYGGTYGEGSLLIGNAPVDYYSVAGASFGLQIGIQKLSTVLFFMTTDRLRKFRERNGWTLGADLQYTLLELSLIHI